MNQLPQHYIAHLFAFARIALLCMLLGSTLPVNDAFSGPPPPTIGDTPAPTIGGNPLASASVFFSSYCAEYPNTLFTKVVYCLERVILESAIYFMQQFHLVMEDVVYAALILSVIMFGTALATGSIQRINRDTLMLLFKIGGVIYFMEDAVEIYWEFIGILMGTLNEISSLGVYTTQLACPVPNAVTDPVLGYYSTVGVWQRIDCIFDLLVGISSDTVITENGGRGDNGLESLSRGMMAYFFYNLQSSAIGILIGMVGLYIVFNLLLSLLRAAYTYLAALVTMSFLFIIGILFIPLILFTNSFENYKRWAKMILAMILQPLILFAYLNVLLIAFDLLLFSAPNSLMRTICGAGSSLETSVHACAVYDEGSKSFSFDVDQRDLVTSTPEQNEGTLGNIEFTEDAPDYSDPSNIPVDYLFQIVNVDGIDNGAAGLAGSVLIVGLCSYILLTFMGEIPRLAHDLGGGINETPNIIAGQGVNLPLSQQISRAATGVQQNIGGRLSSMVGLRG